MLAWNQRDQTSPFMRGYEQLVEHYAIEDRDARARRLDEQSMATFLAPGWQTWSFAHTQSLDSYGLADRLLSSSYAPQDGHPEHAAMLAALNTLFETHAADGRVRFDYVAVIYAGRLVG